MGHEPRGEEGVVSSLAMTVRNTGSSLGVAVFSTLFVTGAGIVSAGMAITDAQRDLGLHTAFTVGCAVALIILISAFYSHERQEPK